MDNTQDFVILISVFLSLCLHQPRGRVSPCQPVSLNQMLTISFHVELALNVILTAIHTTAISLTLFRVYYRTVSRRLWWDDYAAFVAAVLDCGYISVLWFEYAGQGSVLQTHSAMITRYWLGLMLFLVVVWLTRISLALAIARIFPPGEPARIFAIGMAALSTALCSSIIIQSSALCAHQPALISGSNAACVWDTRLRVFVVVANIFSDSILVATPLYKLWGVRLPRKQRRLIFGAFAAGSATTTATIACAVFQFAPEMWEPAKTTLQTKLTYFETGISLIVCNLLVVMTYLHTVMHRGEGLEVSETESSCGQREHGLTHPSCPWSPVLTPYSSGQPYTLTEITGAAVSVDTACHGTESPSDASQYSTVTNTPNITSYTQSVDNTTSR